MQSQKSESLKQQRAKTNQHTSYVDILLENHAARFTRNWCPEQLNYKPHQVAIPELPQPLGWNVLLRSLCMSMESCASIKEPTTDVVPFCLDIDRPTHIHQVSHNTPFGNG